MGAVRNPPPEPGEHLLETIPRVARALATVLPDAAETAGRTTGVVRRTRKLTGAVLARAIRTGDTESERRFDSDVADNGAAGVSRSVKFQSIQLGTESSSVRPPRQHLFASSADPFGFATPLGTLSALHPPAMVH